MTNTFGTAGSIKTAVVTGSHAFDVPGFHALWRSLPEVDFYLQDLDNFAADRGKALPHYDVVLFYNMHRNALEEANGGHMRIKKAIEGLGESEQGIVMLHHAILAYPQWPLWSEIVGIQDRAFDFFADQMIHIEIAKPHHPITEGLGDWRMVDETYIMDEPGHGSTILLTANHPRSMSAIAWTRQHRKARVFCLQSGHDNRVYADPSFRMVVSRGIQWAAGGI